MALVSAARTGNFILVERLLQHNRYAASRLVDAMHASALASNLIDRPIFDMLLSEQVKQGNMLTHLRPRRPDLFAALLQRRKRATLQRLMEVEREAVPYLEDLVQGEMTYLMLAVRAQIDPEWLCEIAAVSDVTVVDPNGNGILQYVSKYGPDPRVAPWLPTGTGCPNVDGATPLYFAAWHGNLAMVTRLLAAGARPEVANSSGWTPLHLAARYSRTDSSIPVLRALLEAARTVNPVNSDGSTPLHLAASHAGKTASVAASTLLMQHGASLSLADRHGNTPLHLAVVCALQGGDPSVMRTLSLAGAPWLASNAAGATPLQLCEKNHSLFRYFVPEFPSLNS